MRKTGVNDLLNRELSFTELSLRTKCSLLILGGRVGSSEPINDVWLPVGTVLGINVRRDKTDR